MNKNEEGAVRYTVIIAMTLVGLGVVNPCFVLGNSHRIQDQFTLLDAVHDLYAINGETDYALQAVFYDKNHLSKVRIVPRFFFDGYHSDWVEPPSPVVLSVSKYHQILDQIEKVQELGKLQQTGRVGIMLNLRSCFRDEYENAIVERAMFRYSPDKEYKVAWFSVKYFHPVFGRLEHKAMDKLDRKFMVTIDGKTYWTKRKTFEGLTVGKQVSIEAAGPISD